jgi:ankyrin repeat protein
MRALVIPSLLLGLACSLAFAQALPPPAAKERALMESAFTGDLAAVKRLVSEGVAVDATDAEKHTALMWSAFNGHTEVVAYLIDHGATVDAKDSAGRTALMYAASGPYAETVKLLLSQGAKVNVQGTLEGFTALMTAAAEGQLEVVRVLLEHGADPALEDEDGDTAESFARQKGHASVVELLQHPPPTARE